MASRAPLWLCLTAQLNSICIIVRSHLLILLYVPERYCLASQCLRIVSMVSHLWRLMGFLLEISFVRSKCWVWYSSCLCSKGLRSVERSLLIVSGWGSQDASHCIWFKNASLKILLHVYLHTCLSVDAGNKGSYQAWMCPTRQVVSDGLT